MSMLPGEIKNTILTTKKINMYILFSSEKSLALTAIFPILDSMGKDSSRTA